MKEYRRLPLTGMSNVRDLGGYAAMDGRLTAYGRFIRSEMPNALTEEDLAFLKQYGVTLTLDFRGDEEISRYPSRLSGLDWVEYRQRAVFNEQVVQGAYVTERPTGDISIEWSEMYISMVEEHRAWVAEILRLAAGASGAVHYHCTTGKDRTGIISMVLLGLCGVSDLDIIADYAVSQIYLRPLFAHFKQIVPTAPQFDMDDPFFRTEPKNMELLLQHIYTAYGSVEGYVRACGVDGETIEGIRKKLLA